MLGLTVILFIMTLTMGVRSLGGREQPAQGQTAEQPAEEKKSGFLRLFERATPTPEPTATPSPTPEPTATPWPGPQIPEQPVEAGAEYYADAGFLGNSVLSGLWMYDYDDILPDDTDHWFWDNGLTVLAAAPEAAKMADMDFGKIYVGFGNNEMSYDRSAIRQAYHTVLDQLEADHPDAIIYLVSCTPVSKYRSNNSSTFTRELVRSYNEMLREVAEERQVWYVDAYSVLCDEEGYLPSEVTGDGTHFTPAHYELWFDYLKTHYIPDGYTPMGTPKPAETPEPVPGAEGGEVG